VEDQVIKEFCSQESTLVHKGNRKRRSVLIQIRRDMDYNLGVYKTFKELNLTPDQQAKLETETAPLLVPPLLIVSAIDSLSRVLYLGRKPTQTINNRMMFIDSAKRLFGLDDDEAAMMWRLRNSLSHAYSLKGFSFVRYAAGGFGTGVRHVIATRPMRAMLQMAAVNLQQILLKLSIDDKRRVYEYLEKEGFLYYLAEDDANTGKSS
jgi:hypothetical protein